MHGAFNAVMLRGRSIREVILEGPGAGGEETATAVIGDLLAVIGTSGTGFLQHDGYYRELERLPHDELQSPFYLRFEVDDEPGVLAQVAQALADQLVSVAQVVQHSGEGVHIVILTHSAREGSVRRGCAGRRRARLQPVRARSAAGARTLRVAVRTAAATTIRVATAPATPPSANTPRTPSRWISVPAHTSERA